MAASASFSEVQEVQRQAIDGVCCGRKCGRDAKMIGCKCFGLGAGELTAALEKNCRFLWLIVLRLCVHMRAVLLQFAAVHKLKYLA